MRRLLAVPAALAALAVVIGASYAVHRGPTPHADAGAAGGPSTATGRTAATTTTTLPPPTTTTTLPHPVAGLAWAPLGQPVAGRSPMQVALVANPPGAAPSAAVVWIDQTQVSAQLIPGLQLPGGTGWSPFGMVPVAQRAALIAAFNGGFKFTDSRGGFFAQGRAAYPLVPGVASLVIRADGTATVGVWDRDVTAEPTVVAVRQNLDLLVDAGAPTPLVTRPYPYWGLTPNRSQVVWRSAVGVDAQGNLVYAAAANITPPDLATLMVQAGCLRAMQLDINHGFVSFNTYVPAATPAGSQGTRLLAAMANSGDRYLTPDTRDFVALYRR